VIVGQMGYGQAVSVTAIGDAVNTASRLESMTKEAGVQLVVSEAVAERGGLSREGLEPMPVMVRGRAEPLVVFKVAEARSLPAA
jgi:adenylate cyclase